jgi:hypothetical protein
MEQFWSKYSDMCMLLLAVMLSSSVTTRLNILFVGENPLFRSLAFIASWFLLTAIFGYGMRKNKKINSPPAD